MKQIAILDYETLPIGKRPKQYPPRPIGFSIGINNKFTYYLIKSEVNEDGNITWGDAKRKLQWLYKNYRIVCHRAQFDLEVGHEWFDLPIEPPHGWECTLLLAFLYDPRVENLKLKWLAWFYLGMKADEQNKLFDWIRENVKQRGIKQRKDLGEFVYLAPFRLQKAYGNGDTKRTHKLFYFFYDYVMSEMKEQYAIEKNSVMKAIKFERGGIRIDKKNIEPAIDHCIKARKRHVRELKKVLGNINFKSSQQKVEAFEKAGLVEYWNYTEPTDKFPDGQPKTGIDDLIEVCTDSNVIMHLDRFSRYNKLLDTYMIPWYESACKNDGLFYPWFNTVKGDNDKGTYTGRWSSNFQQVPRRPVTGYKFMPFLRRFILPDDPQSQFIFVRDFSQQEIRILAHYEHGTLFLAYIDNPYMDVHAFVKGLIEGNQGIHIERTYVKNCNFLIVYGGGVNALYAQILKAGGIRQNNITIEECKVIFKSHSKALPGIKELKTELMEMAADGLMFRTAGGRLYEFVSGKEYVALNTLIQGSAADHTKRSIKNVDEMIEAKSYNARIMLPVHDEIVCSGPKNKKVMFMTDFKHSMEEQKLFDLYMLTDGKIGKNWGDAKKYKLKGER